MAGGGFRVFGLWGVDFGAYDAPQAVSKEESVDYELSGSDLSKAYDLGRVARALEHAATSLTPVLRRLDLANCGLGRDGTRCLLRPLEVAGCRVTILCLDGNNIGDEGLFCV